MIQYECILENLPHSRSSLCTIIQYDWILEESSSLKSIFFVLQFNTIGFFKSSSLKVIFLCTTIEYDWILKESSSLTNILCTGIQYEWFFKNLPHSKYYVCTTIQYDWILEASSLKDILFVLRLNTIRSWGILLTQNKFSLNSTSIRSPWNDRTSAHLNCIQLLSKGLAAGASAHK